MRDIVATIQADQYRLITREPEPPLVVQGGPGTGKTAVGLHRASYLLFSQRERLRRVLVVGPNPTFMEYVSHVLPTLGEESVEQRAVSQLVDGISPTVADPPAVERLKGDLRMADVIGRAAAERSRAHPEELVARMEGEYVRVREREVIELLDRAREELGLTAHARERFRMDVLRRFYEDYGARLGGMAWRDFSEVERALQARGFLTRWLARVWPVASPDGLVRSLLTSRATFARQPTASSTPTSSGCSTGHGPASHGASTTSRSRRGACPARGDAAAVRARDRRRGAGPHPDAASRRRPPRERRILTILGDIAQATGPVAYPSWEEVLAHLPGEAEVEELRHAYACPPRSWSWRCRSSSESRRTSPRVPRRRRAAQGRARAAGRARRRRPSRGARAGRGGGASRGDPPEPLLPEVEAHSAYDDGIPLLSPRRVKGLEFDHVVVVEPALIAEGETGLRELYVALTRPTRTLVVVHAHPLRWKWACPRRSPRGRPAVPPVQEQ